MNTNGERLVNRILIAIAAMVILVILAAPMRSMTTAQFVTCKVVTMIAAWVVWKKTLQLEEEGRL